jgi:hypothetical protein
LQIISFYTVGYGDYLPETENQRVFTTFYVCLGFALLCVIGVTAGDVFHNAVRTSNQTARSKRVLDMLGDARTNAPVPSAAAIAAFSGADESKPTERDTLESRDSRGSHTSTGRPISTGHANGVRKVPSRRLSMMNKSNQGDIFPSPYSINDPRMLELMRKVNMDMFDEDLEVILMIV